MLAFWACIQPGRTKVADLDDPIIRFTDVHKHFGDFEVLKGVSLEVQRGAQVVICGPSGSGKSTLIRCINALEAHQSGSIMVDGVPLDK